MLQGELGVESTKVDGRVPSGVGETQTRPTRRDTRHAPLAMFVNASPVRYAGKSWASGTHARFHPNPILHTFDLPAARVAPL